MHDMIRDGIIVAVNVRVRVWLKRKLAECVDGVDLSGREVGDVLDLSPREASLLMAEDHAEPDRRADIRGSARRPVRRSKEKKADAA